MQFSVENTSELERRMTIQVPAERIDQLGLCLLKFQVTPEIYYRL